MQHFQNELYPLSRRKAVLHIQVNIHRKIVYINSTKSIKSTSFSSYITKQNKTQMSIRQLSVTKLYDFLVGRKCVINIFQAHLQ